MSASQEEIPPPPPPPPSSQTPTQQTPHTVSTIKLPILKKGEYDIWAMKMEHYLAHTDYPIWEVIQNGNGPVSITTDTSGQIKVLPPRTAEEIVARERERKARTTLLMALPEDHLAKFHKMTDAKEIFKGFSVSNTEGLHKGYDRFQSLLTQLEIHGAGVSTEDANQKFLRSLPSAWSVTVTNHLEDEDYALMALQHSYSDTEREQLSDASIEIKAYSQGLKKVEAQLVAHQQGQLWFVTAEGMHAVPPPMTGNYMPSGPDVEVDDSKFTYGPKQTQPSESESQTSEIDTCKSNISAKLSELVSEPEPLSNESNEEFNLRSKFPSLNTARPSVLLEEKGKLLLSPQQVVIGDHKNTMVDPNTIVDLDYPHRALKNKGIVDSGFSKAHDWNKPTDDFKTLMVALLLLEVVEVISLVKFKLPDENQVLLKIPRQNNMYSFNLENIVPSGGLACLPLKIFQNDHTCVACQKGKQHKASCKAKAVSSISQTLQLLHMDLFGPTSVRSLNHKNLLPCKDETSAILKDLWFSICLIKSLRTKDETSAILKDFIRQIENQLNQKVKTIRSDNGTEFKNNDVSEICGQKGSRGNTAEAVSTACYVLNRVLVTKPHNKTPYELLTSKIPIISYIRPFGCHVTILNTIDHLGKFAGKSDEGFLVGYSLQGFLVGYSLQSKAFRVYNLETKRVEENKPNVAGKGPTWLFDLDYLTDSMNYHPVSSENQANLHASQQEANL
ncbi:putative ribonuclease H-like domain-containing protein [Tanacetum coccineum]